MNPYHFALLILAVLMVALVATWAKGFSRRKQPPLYRLAYLFNAASGFVQGMRHRVGPPVYALANFGEGEHLDGKISYIADNVFAARFLLAMTGSDQYHKTPTVNASDEPFAVCTDSPVAGDGASFDVFGSAPGTKRGTGVGAIAADVAVYTAANGQLQGEPNVAGTYWLCGRSLTPCAGAGDTFEFTSIKPIKVVVIAALNSVQNATAAAVDLPTTEALANALKANYNALQADVAALAGALASPALVKVI